MYSQITRDAVFMFIGGLIALIVADRDDLNNGHILPNAVLLIVIAGTIYLVRRVMIWTRQPK